MIRLNGHIFWELGNQITDLLDWVLKLNMSGEAVVLESSNVIIESYTKIFLVNDCLCSPHSWDTWEEGEFLREEEKKIRSTMYYVGLLIDKKYVRITGSLNFDDIVKFSAGVTHSIFVRRLNKAGHNTVCLIDGAADVTLLKSSTSNRTEGIYAFRIVSNLTYIYKGLNPSGDHVFYYYPAYLD